MSSTRIASSAQFAALEAVTLGVKGSGVSVIVGGTSVGKTRFGFVGGSVEVTKTTGASLGKASGETFTQDARRKMRRKIQYAVLFMVPGV
jgi:hypothetical protein